MRVPMYAVAVKGMCLNPGYFWVSSGLGYRLPRPGGTPVVPPASKAAKSLSIHFCSDKGEGGGLHLKLRGHNPYLIKLVKTFPLYIQGVPEKRGIKEIQIWSS